MTKPINHNVAVPALFICVSALAGCTTTSARTPAIAYDDPPVAIMATPAAEPPHAVEVVTIPEPLPLPGQLEPVSASASCMRWAISCAPASTMTAARAARA